MHGPAEALGDGVKVAGCHPFLVDAGVDSGADRRPGRGAGRGRRHVESLHERIKVAERAMLVDTVGRMARGLDRHGGGCGSA